MKDVAITEHVTFSFGAAAYNLLKHMNFDQPVADIANPQFALSITAPCYLYQIYILRADVDL
jgi:hypothetical protein